VVNDSLPFGLFAANVTLNYGDIATFSADRTAVFR